VRGLATMGYATDEETGMGAALVHRTGTSKNTEGAVEHVDRADQARYAVGSEGIDVRLVFGRR